MRLSPTDPQNPRDNNKSFIHQSDKKSQWQPAEVIGFVFAGYIRVNADVAHCFVFTNKAALARPTNLHRLIHRVRPRQAKRSEPRDEIIQGVDILPGRGGEEATKKSPTTAFLSSGRPVKFLSGEKAR